MATSRYHFLQNQRPSLGGELGSSLGTGLGTGLAALAESKLDKMITSSRRSEDKQKLIALGMPERDAEFLSHQDADRQWEGARAWIIAGGVPEEMVPKTLDEDWNISPEQEQAAQQQLQEKYGQQLGQPAQGPMGALEQLGQGQPQQKQPGVAQALGMQQAAPMQPQQRPKSLGEAYKMAEAKSEGPGDATAQKETKEYYDKVSEEARAAKNNEIRLKKLEKLIDSNKLNSPTFASTIKFLHLGGYGPDLGSWLNADTQEFQKLSTDFVKDAKQIFGSRMTDADLKTFLDTIPTITQSDEAKRRVIKNMRVFNGAARLRKDAMDQIISANGGKRPADLDVQVERAVEPYLDKLASDFKANESENKPFVGQLLKSLPDASQYPAGAEIRDKKSGTVYRSDGNQWIKV